MSQSFGAGYYPAQQPQRVPERHPRAVAALVLGLSSLFLCGFFTGIPAVFTGRRVLREIRFHPHSWNGAALARIGFWTGLVGTVWSLVTVALVIALIVHGDGSSCHTVSQHHPHRHRTC